MWDVIDSLWSGIREWGRGGSFWWGVFGCLAVCVLFFVIFRVW
jgi:hypothetical protein